MTGWEVVCEDGQVRHDDVFLTLTAAETRADTGHPCTNRHTYQQIITLEVDQALDEDTRG